MKRFQGYRRFAALFALFCLFGLNGCNSFRDSLSGEDSINYKSVVRADPLSIPPDLTQAASDPRYKAPAGAANSTTYSQYQQGQVAAKNPQQVARASNVLPERTDMRVERDGDLRWLVVNLPPDQVFPKVSDFWTENGFVLDVVDPKAGLLVTNWAENRAKIPESWIRQALGSILEGLWDSGTRDKFRTRIERSATPGRTEIYISHQHMEEKSTLSGTETDVRWVNGREDPGLNAAMLARLMVFLGDDIDGARRKMAQAQRSPQEPKVTEPVAGDKTTLIISESFERAWRSIRVALAWMTAIGPQATTLCVMSIPTPARSARIRASSADCLVPSRNRLRSSSASTWRRRATRRKSPSSMPMANAIPARRRPGSSTCLAARSRKRLPYLPMMSGGA